MNEHSQPSNHYTATHWGAYHPERDAQGRLSLRPVADDPDPSPIGRSLADAVDDKLRIEQPMVRAGWLDNGSALW